MSAAAPVRVAFVSSHAGLGGSERALELLLGALGPAWVDRVVALEDGPALERLARAAGTHVEVVRTGRRAGIVPAAWRLRRTLLAGARPAVVHANGVKAALVAGLALRGTGVPVLWVKHDFSWDGRPGRAVARLCAEVVGVSDAVLAALRAGGRRPPLTVVPNGIPDPDGDRGRGRAALAVAGVPADAPVVVLLGRLHPAKGQLPLVDAVPELRRRVPGAHVVLAGPEDATQVAYAQRVRARIAELGLDGAVHVLGHRDDAADLLAAADVAAVPSVRDERGMGREGFGLAGVEALALGTPVVGSDDGALPEVLGDAAVLVPPGDPAALADALATLLLDRAERERLAERGRRRFEARYRLATTTEAMAGRYRALASRHSATAQPASTAASAATTFDRSV